MRCVDSEISDTSKSSGQETNRFISMFSSTAPVVHLADEMLDHLLRYLEIGDDAVAQRPDGLNVARGAAEHQFRFLADGEDLFPAPDAGDRHHRWLVQHDPAPFHVDDGVCRAEVDRHVGRQKTKHSSKHLTANPIEKRSISLSDWPAISQWPTS